MVTKKAEGTINYTTRETTLKHYYCLLCNDLGNDIFSDLGQDFNQSNGKFCRKTFENPHTIMTVSKSSIPVHSTATHWKAFGLCSSIFIYRIKDAKHYLRVVVSSGRATNI